MHRSRHGILIAGGSITHILDLKAQIASLGLSSDKAPCFGISRT
jgi:hypothetical protein